MSPRAERRHAAMMSRGSPLPVALFAGSLRAEGQVRTERWDRHARVWRAVKACAVLWGVAALSILIPVAHFVLVPAFLIAGPVVAFRRLRETSGVLGGEGTCPLCSHRLLIEAHADEWPLYAPCEACGASVPIEGSSSLAG